VIHCSISGHPQDAAAYALTGRLGQQMRLRSNESDQFLVLKAVMHGQALFGDTSLTHKRQHPLQRPLTLSFRPCYFTLCTVSTVNIHSAQLLAFGNLSIGPPTDDSACNKSINCPWSHSRRIRGPIHWNGKWTYLWFCPCLWDQNHEDQTTRRHCRSSRIVSVAVVSSLDSLRRETTLQQIKTVTHSNSNSTYYTQYIRCTHRVANSSSLTDNHRPMELWKTMDKHLLTEWSYRNSFET